MTNGALAGQPEGPSQLVVAAARGYRDSAAAGAHLVGPAKFLGQRVRAGERVPVLHGDHVELARLAHQLEIGPVRVTRG